MMHTRIDHEITEFESGAGCGQVSPAIQMWSAQTVEVIVGSFFPGLLVG
jgi:hypothetical protein